MSDKIEEMDDEAGEIITLVNENNEEVEFEHVGTVDYKGNWYVVLLPVQPMEDIEADEVIIYKMDEDESGEDVFLPIESEEELQGVFEAYQSMVEEDEEDGECDCDECKCDNCDCDKK